MEIVGFPPLEGLFSLLGEPIVKHFPAYCCLGLMKHTWTTSSHVLESFPHWFSAWDVLNSPKEPVHSAGVHSLLPWLLLE